MKAIKCEVHEPHGANSIKITCHRSIRAALRYCKQNGISRRCIFTKNGSICNMVFGNGMILSL